MLIKTLPGPLILSALSFGLTDTVFAATTVQNKIPQEETLIVTANRSETRLWDSPATIQVIGNKQLQYSTQVSVADNLRDIAGVEITDNALAGRKQIRIRGEASSRVLILIDGQEVTYQRGGQNYGPGLLIDESAIERIEVVKGPWSVLYGSQAIGGVVNFITKKGGDTPLAGTIKTVYNSSTAGWAESAAAWGSTGNFDYRINGSYSDQGLRDTPDGRLPYTNFRNNSQAVWLGYRFGQHKTGISIDRYNLATQTYFEDSDNQFDAFSVKIPKLERQKVGVFYDNEINGDYLKKVHLDAWYQTIDRKLENEVAVTQMITGLRPQRLSIQNQTNTIDKQYSQSITLQHDFSLPANNDLVTGIKYQHDRVKQNSSARQSTASELFSNTTATLADQQSTQSNTSLFAQNNWRFADNWAWTAGVRQYWLSSKLTSDNSHSTIGGIVTQRSAGQKTTRDNQLVSSTSLRYSGLENLELRAAIAQGYVFPTLTQLFSQLSTGGSVTYGNPELGAEHSTSYEMGARYKGNEWLIDGAFYYSEAKDYIAMLACTGQTICNGATSRGGYYYANIDRTTTWGTELTAAYKGWLLSPYLSGNFLRRQYDNANFKTTDTGEPAISGRLGLKHLLILDNISLSSDFYLRAASGATYKTSATETRYPGWATLNLALNSEFGPQEQYQINLALNNLTNKRYTTTHESIPASGFNAAVGFAWNF